MALSAEDQKTYEERDRLYSTAKQSECSVCGWSMSVRIQDGRAVIACPRDPTHQGYRRLRSLTQLAKAGEYISYVSELVARREQEKMETQDPETQALTVYGTERHLMTADIARQVIAHIWPGAGAPAVARAIMICAQHNLNPLMKDLYIIHFEGKSDKDEVVLGIDGYRKMARRRTAFSYRDGPRAMTAQEVEATGEDPKLLIGAYVALQTPGGGRFPGYGFWPRDQEPLGRDKGNTKFNMACKRAEAAALRRVMPDNELPAPVDIDGTFADIAEVAAIAPPSSQVDRETGELAEGLGHCPVHHKPFKSGRYGPYCGTKLADGSWCKEKSGKILNGDGPKPAPAARPPTPGIEPAEVVEVGRQDMLAEGPPAIRDEDFLAMSDVEQARLLLQQVEELKRDQGAQAFVRIREELGITKTAVELAPEDRLRVLKAVIGTKAI